MTDASPPRAIPSVSKESGPKSKPRHVFRRAGIGLLVILVVGLGLAGTSGYWIPAIEKRLPTRSQSPDALAALDQRLGAIERKLDALDALNDRIAALEQRPAPDASAAVAPLQDQLQQVSARLDQDEARVAQLIKDQSQHGDSAQRVLIVALADLGNAVSTSRPFAAQLASVEALGQSRPGWGVKLRPLEDAAKSGIPSTAVLAQRFSDETAAAILRADAATPNPQAGFGEAMLAKLRSLVVIRRTDGSADGGSPVDATVATAESALAKGDLAGAAAALGNLTGAPAEAAAPWLQLAQQRLQAEQTVAALTQEISSDLAAGAGGG